MEIAEAINRWTEEILPSKQALFDALKKHKLTIYHGMDPTGPDLHLGHSTNYLLMRALQDAGHKVILLIGDFTARIGDPSDKTAARKKLSESQIKRNLATYKKQVGKILPLNGENPVEIRFNSAWLSKLTATDILELAAHFTHQQLIERDMFQRRIKEEKSVFVHELLYPIFQGYDSVAMKVDAEIGGSDQLFNMMVGRELVKKILGKEKFVITTPLLVNPKTGRKLMSKTEGSYIALNDKPEEMFAKVLTLPDETTHSCFLLCTTVPEPEIQSIEKRVQSNEISAMDAKKNLAWEIVKLYHGEEKANKAQGEFEGVFQKKEFPTNLPEVSVRGGSVDLLDLLVEKGVAKSRSEVKRLLEQRGVEANGEVVTEFILNIPPRGTTLRIGKHRFLRVKQK